MAKPGRACALLDLDPTYVKGSGPRTVQTKGVEFAQAEGIQFDCPACPTSHCIMVFWKPNQDWDGGHNWSVAGGPGFDNLTLSPSIDGTVGGGCKFHGWVRNGQVTW